MWKLYSCLTECLDSIDQTQIHCTMYSVHIIVISDKNWLTKHKAHTHTRIAFDSKMFGPVIAQIKQATEKNHKSALKQSQASGSLLRWLEQAPKHTCRSKQCIKYDNFCHYCNLCALVIYCNGWRDGVPLSTCMTICCSLECLLLWAFSFCFKAFIIRFFFCFFYFIIRWHSAKLYDSFRSSSI